MRIKSKFVDADGERDLDECVPSNHEGTKMVKDIWVKSFEDMLMDALKEGDDIEILVKRVPSKVNEYAA